jgi:hypothetical protein
VQPATGFQVACVHSMEEPIAMPHLPEEYEHISWATEKQTEF